MRGPRFRLRTLLTTVVVCCVLFGAIGVELRNARRSRLLYERLGHATYEAPFFESRRIFGVSVDDIPGWNSLADLLGEPFLRRRLVHLGALRQPSPSDQSWQLFTDETLADVAVALPCEGYSLDATRISDAGMKHFARIPKLKNLWLLHLDVSSEGLTELSKAQNLEHLLIKGSKISDATVARIHELASVHELQLVGTSLTEAGLRCVARMPRLSYLFIASSPLSDEHVTEISMMKSLQCLDLCGVQLRDEHLAKIATLPQLKYLQLFNNSITDEGLQKLVAAQQLVWIDLRSTDTSQVGRMRLRQAIPGIEIHTDPKPRMAQPRPLWRP